MSTAWKVSKCGVFFGPYFPVFGLNTGKYGPEKTPYLDTFHAVELNKTTNGTAILQIWDIIPLAASCCPKLF